MMTTKQWSEDSPHGPRCAQRFHGANACDCGKAGALNLRPVEIVGEFGCAIAYLSTDHDQYADLIAAAPELLFACELVISHEGKLTGADFATLRAAIANATGSVLRRQTK